MNVDLNAYLKFDLDDAALERLAWKDVGGGTKMAKLARDGETGCVFYRIGPTPENSAPFKSHEHPGGEVYLVVRGTIVDESGRYPAGSLVWMAPGSRHTPRGEGDDTVIVVLWPNGIKA